MPAATPTPSRILNVDIIRILAMLMVFALHPILNFTVRLDFFATKLWFLLEPLVALSKTCVLLFFMLSGFLLLNKNRTIKDNWQKTKQRIIIPLSFFSVLDVIFEFGKLHYDWGMAAIFFQSQLVRLTNFPSSPLWFLVVLVFLYLLNPVWQLIFAQEKNRNLARYLLAL